MQMLFLEDHAVSVAEVMILYRVQPLVHCWLFTRGHAPIAS